MIGGPGGTEPWGSDGHSRIEIVLARLQAKIALATSSRFFWHVLRLPMEFYYQRFPGEIGSRVQLNDNVAGLLSGQLATTVIAMVTTRIPVNSRSR